MGDVAYLAREDRGLLGDDLAGRRLVERDQVVKLLLGVGFGVKSGVLGLERVPASFVRGSSLSRIRQNFPALASASFQPR